MNENDVIKWLFGHPVAGLAVLAAGFGLWLWNFIYEMKKERSVVWRCIAAFRGGFRGKKKDVDSK